MAINTLQAIIQKVRKLTITNNSTQLTDSTIIDYINSFYLYDFPAEFRSLKLKDVYTFDTYRGIDVYPFDSEHWQTVQVPAYCMKRSLQMFHDTMPFMAYYAASMNWQTQANFTQGNGTSGPYSGAAQLNTANSCVVRSYNNNPQVTTTLNSTSNFLAAPNKPSFPQAVPSRVQNLLITGQTVLGSQANVSDDGNGNLIGDCLPGGTINYLNGVIQNLIFATGGTAQVPIVAGSNIQLQYIPVQMNIPFSILFFQNQFTLRPVPDQGYTIELTGYRLPSQALLGTTDPNNPNMAGTPELNEWWECIAVGASKKVYEDRLDMEGVAMMEKILEQRYQVGYTRTYAEMSQQRVPSIYAQQLSNGNDSWNGGWGWGSGGSN